MPGRLGSIALHKDGGIVSYTRLMFCKFAPGTARSGASTTSMHAMPDNRLNDRKIDRLGRYRCVSRGLNGKDALGSIFRLDPDQSCHRMDAGFIVGNGLAISPDDRIMIVGDTAAEVAYIYDFDLAAGVISNRQPFCSTRDMPRFLDDGTFDENGSY